MKIFVTVGTQLPFDRLIATVDQWAASHPEIDVFGQIGPTAYRPQSMKFAPFIGAGELRQHVEESAIVIAHAGMGSVLTALEVGRPIIVMPRRAVFGEHRNDHQIATARSLLAQGRVIVAFDESHLVEKLNSLERLTGISNVSRHASPELISAIRQFILKKTLPASSPTVESPIQQPFAREEPDLGELRRTRRSGRSSVAASVDEQVATLTLPMAGTATEQQSRRHVVQRTIRPVRKTPPPQLGGLAAVVLLEGTVRRSPFAQACGRSLLELPVSGDRSILGVWRDQIEDLREALGLDGLRCRIVAGHNAQPPQLHPLDIEAGMSIERDPADLRGTGGVLRDIAAGYEDDEYLLVANAAQVLTTSLKDAVVDLSSRTGGVSIYASTEGTPTSLALISCKALRDLPPVGFVDFKEQALRLLSEHHDVTVHSRPHSLGFSIRTGVDYLNALRSYHARTQPSESASTRRRESWQRTFSVVEAGASVDEAACLHDAVVFAGARVEAGAMVARSIVAGCSRVRARQHVVEQLVTQSVQKSLNSLNN